MDLNLAEIEIGDGNNGFSIAPGRGGLVTRLLLDGANVLFLDRDTFVDPTRSVRGGIPILFPAGGPSHGNEWTHGGQTYPMKQHGFARDLPWDVVAESRDRVTIGLEASPATRVCYPFDFALRYTFIVRAGRLRIEQQIENRSSESMPFVSGFHPYFATADKKALHMHVPASHAAQNPFGTPAPFEGYDFDAESIDVTFTDATAPRMAMDDAAAGHTISISGSPEYRYLVFWTLRGRPFCCLEPWTARGGALNSGEDLLFVPSGEARSLFVEIARTRLNV